VAETETENIDNQVTEDPLTDEDSIAAREPEMDVIERTNAMQLRDEIEEYRHSVENSKSELEKGTIDLTTARAKISQEWQKLDFYKKGDEVVRIKTYPIAEQDEKTEEFYFIDNQLVFALVESKGNERSTMEDETSGMAFYYDEGQLIISEGFEVTEATAEEKNEMILATNLQSEAKNYLQLIYESKEE